jgi:hypothetical protein
MPLFCVADILSFEFELRGGVERFHKALIGDIHALNSEVDIIDRTDVTVR